MQDYEINNLSFCYGKKLFKNINISFNKGDIIGLIGPNGSGKSTLLKLIKNKYKINSFIINGPSFYPWLNAKDNLSLVQSLYKNTLDIDFVLLLVGLNNNKLNYSKYSTGMKMRLAIAKCIMVNSDIYLFDEPLNGLDIESIILFRQIIKYLKQSHKTMIIATHLLKELNIYVNKLWYIKDGNLFIYNIDKMNNNYILSLSNIPEELITYKVGDNKVSINGDLDQIISYIKDFGIHIYDIEKEDIIEKLYLGESNA